MVKHPQAPRKPEHLGVDVADLKFAQDNEFDEILSVHILEHFYEWEVQGVLKEWARVLRPGGKLIVEMPDVVKAARNLIEAVEGDKWHMWPLYGDNTLKDPLMCHKWGWCAKTITPYLERAGFTKIKEKEPQWHGRKKNRDFRIEAMLK